MNNRNTSFNQSIPLLNGPMSIAGAVNLHQRPDGLHPVRYWLAEKDLFPQGVVDRASDTAGVRLRFRSNTRAVRLEVVPANPQEHAVTWQFDLLVSGKMHRASLPLSSGVAAFEGWETGEHTFELFLSQEFGTVIRGIYVEDGATVLPWLDERPRWTVYGSSITHCKRASGPSETWPSIVATNFGLNCTSLGFGGNCHLEPLTARMVASLPADYISVCVGINVYGGSSMSPRTFPSAVLGLIMAIRDRQPTTPLAVVSPIFSLNRETQMNNAGQTLVMMRAQIADVVEKVRARGDRQLHYVDGLALFGEAYDYAMPDHLHPDAEGCRLLGQRYGELVMPQFGLSPEKGI